VAHEVWRVMNRYRVVRREDIETIMAALQRSVLDQRVAQQVTAAQRDEIEALKREIAMLAEQRDDNASRIAELAARVERILDGLSRDGA